MPRPRLTDRPTSWHIHLPTSLVQEVDLLLMNSSTERTAYASRGKLVERLLRAWLAQQRLPVTQEQET